MSLEKLLKSELFSDARVWRGSHHTEGKAGLASGFTKLDRCLPGGGWPPAALTEILTGHYGIGELRLLMPALARLTAASAKPQYEDSGDRTEPGWIAWVAPPFQPYAPALQQYGIDLTRVLLVRPADDSELLWSAEQALSSGTCAAVLLWTDTLDDQASRRLQLAAEKGKSWAIAFRPLSARQQPSAAALRLELQSTDAGMRVHILKCRGGRPAVLDSLL